MTEQKPASVTPPQGAPKQVGETSSAKDWVDRSIWTERMLQRLAQSQLQTKWFALWDKVWRESSLSNASLQEIRTNGFRTGDCSRCGRTIPGRSNPENHLRESRMPEMGLSGLAGGVRLIPHPYPIQFHLFNQFRRCGAPLDPVVAVFALRKLRPRRAGGTGARWNNQIPR